MNMRSLQKWMTIGTLALAPLAYAQSPEALDRGMQTSVDEALTATPPKTAEEQQIEALSKELDGIRAELDARRARDDQRELLLGDPNSHPLWP